MFDNLDLMVEALATRPVGHPRGDGGQLHAGAHHRRSTRTMHVSPAPPARWLATAYTGLFKNIPLLAVLFILYFGFPKIGIPLSSWQWAIIGLGTYTAAFVGETLRAGINSIDLGQAEAARSIGLTFGQSLRYVILPQAVRTVIPPLGSLLTALVRTVHWYWQSVSPRPLPRRNA